MSEETRRLTRQSRAIWASLEGPRGRTSADWAAWKAEQLGIAMPDCAHNQTLVWQIEPNQDGSGVATLYWKEHAHDCWQEAEQRRKYEPKRRWVDTPGKYTPTGITLPVPAHAMDCKRADLWHEAHQAGKPPAECWAEGQGWRVNADRAAKARQTRYANMLTRRGAA